MNDITKAEIESGELILNHPTTRRDGVVEISKYHYKVKPNHANFMPVIIDEIGNYKTRDGRTVQICEIKESKYFNEDGVFESLAKGYIIIKRSGKKDKFEYGSWHVSGQSGCLVNNSRDIIEKL